MNFYFRCLAVLALALTGTMATAQAAPAADASSVVDDLHTALITSMKQADAQSYAQRYKALEPVIERSFDLDSLAQSSVRGYWNKFSTAQQRSFKDHFTRISIDTYVQRFDDFNGERFETLDDTEIARGNHQVKTQLTTGKGEKISLVYVLRPVDDEWRIANVVAQGVSDLALKRSQYVGVLKKQGVEAFLARIQSEVEALPPIR